MAVPQGAVRVPANSPAQIKANRRSITITCPTPTTHCAGLKLNANKGITKFKLDRGIFTGLRFKGSTGPDRLTLGSQAVVVTNSRGLVIDFGKDSAKDVFTFTNTHREGGSPLKHLQRSTIKHFGKEDQIVLQGKTYGYGDVSATAPCPALMP